MKQKLRKSQSSFEKGSEKVHHAIDRNRRTRKTIIYSGRDRSASNVQMQICPLRKHQISNESDVLEKNYSDNKDQNSKIAGDMENNDMAQIKSPAQSANKQRPRPTPRLRPSREYNHTSVRRTNIPISDLIGKFQDRLHKSELKW